MINLHQRHTHLYTNRFRMSQFSKFQFMSNKVMNSCYLYRNNLNNVFRPRLPFEQHLMKNYHLTSASDSKSFFHSLRLPLHNTTISANYRIVSLRNVCFSTFWMRHTLILFSLYISHLEIDPFVYESNKWVHIKQWFFIVFLRFYLRFTKNKEEEAENDTKTTKRSILTPT